VTNARTVAESMWSDTMNRPHLREADLRALADALQVAGDRKRARYCLLRADHIAARMASR